MSLNNLKTQYLLAFNNYENNLRSRFFGMLIFESESTFKEILYIQT